jgi:hypothetical protein
MPLKQVIFGWIKELLSKPDLLYLMEKELQEAARDLLRAESTLEYARCMVEYNTARVERLKSHIKLYEGTQ